MWSTKLLKKYRNDLSDVVISNFSLDGKPDLKNVLILSKRTRYELEKIQNPGKDDAQMEKIIRSRGSDFNRIIKHHHIHKNFHNQLVAEFSKANFNVESIGMSDYSNEAVSWADLVVPAGGDGTFLLAASKVFNNMKPVVGFNSDPARSEGFLCLPPYYSKHIGAAVNRILKQDYKWLLRSRIETKLTASKSCEEKLVGHRIYRGAKTPEIMTGRGGESKPFTSGPFTIPYLSLNEVFLGESASSQVSYFDVKVNNFPRTIVKCSGMCVCTGTGSTSWHLSINRLSENKVKHLLEIAGVKCDDIPELTKAYNKSLVFPPDDSRMYYTLRDLIIIGVLPYPKGLPAGDFVNGSIKVYSKCFAANLVVDGGTCYPFNDGCVAELAILPKNSLRTIALT